MMARPVVTSVSHATRPTGSCASIASRMESEIWSAILSGCPSVTDSDVNRYRPLRPMSLELLELFRVPTAKRDFLARANRSNVPDHEGFANPLRRFERSAPGMKSIVHRAQARLEDVGIDLSR